MGNTISSIKTVVVNSIKNVFSGYREFADRCFKYYFRCPSYPLVENIINDGVIYPCKIVVVLAEIICGISMDAGKLVYDGSILAYETIKNHIKNNPEETVVDLLAVISCHYYTVGEGVTAFSGAYFFSMGCLQMIYWGWKVMIMDKYNNRGMLIHDEHGNQWMHVDFGDVYENMRVREQQQLLAHALWRPGYNNPVVRYH
tara:strand:+ start:1811 stop:2410 length:600 start_codon:yes stop_codon:yes gene_type:complete